MSSFLDKAKALGGKAVEATADAVEIGTLKAKIAARKGDIEKQYEALGEIIYENRSTLELNPEEDPEAEVPNPNVQADPLVGIVNAGSFLEYKGNNGHSVIFTRSSQGMLFLTIAHGGAGMSGTEIDEAVVLRRDGDGYVFGKLDGSIGEITVFFGGSSITVTNGQGSNSHLNGTYVKR